MPCPTSAVKHLVNYLPGQEEGEEEQKEGGMQRRKRGEEGSLLTLLAFLLKLMLNISAVDK